jgi:phosphoribosylamine--glycine ligase
MKILVVGSGGREHALCWAIAASPMCDALFCAPGNGGIARHATCVDISAEATDDLLAFCRDQAIDFVVVGPEAPLVAGLVDRLEADGIEAFGPSAAAAQLEGSKAFTKALCRRHNIPTAGFERFTDIDAAKAYVRAHGAPLVVKADGLAAGKGVTVAQSVDEALAALDTIGEGAFGAAGAEVLIEECLVGEEASFFALVDGEIALPLAGAQDHKAVGDGDTGPNTGGMGAYSPAPVLDDALARQVMVEIIEPTVKGMAAEGHPFKGVLYAGLMITADGPQLLEYNVRFGDPECQVLMARLKSDIVPALMASHDGELDRFDLRWRDEAALCVVMASNGYPGPYQKGTEIRGLAALEAEDADGDLVVFHAGTEAADDHYRATGGRVLGVTALGATVADAQARAYKAVDRIDWPDGFCRRDIGWRAIDRS